MWKAKILTNSSSNNNEFWSFVINRSKEFCQTAILSSFQTITQRILQHMSNYTYLTNNTCYPPTPKRSYNISNLHFKTFYKLCCIGEIRTCWLIIPGRKTDYR